jgi:hypothetical protein
MRCLLTVVTAACAAGTLLSGCAATGDWREDTIFFDSRLAEEHLDPKRQELSREQRGATDEQICQATLRQELRGTQRRVAANEGRVRELQRRKRAAEAKLAQVEAALGSSSSGGDAAETQRLLEEKRVLRAEVNRLDTLLANILEAR